MKYPDSVEPNGRLCGLCQDPAVYGYERDAVTDQFVCGKCYGKLLSEFVKNDRPERDVTVIAPVRPAQTPAMGNPDDKPICTVCGIALKGRKGVRTCSGKCRKTASRAKASLKGSQLCQPCQP